MGSDSCHGEWPFKRTKLSPSSSFTSPNAFGQDCDRASVAGKHSVAKTCRILLFLCFYRHTFNVHIIYIQKSTQITRAQLDVLLQSELTVVPRIQTKRQSATKDGDPSESHLHPLPCYYPEFPHHSLISVYILHKSNGLSAQHHVWGIHSHYCMEM